MTETVELPEERTSILLVDDRPENLMALEAVLSPLGQDLVTATSGEDALRRLLTHDFALILLDVLMPGLDGFETAKLIRGRPRSRHVPIIFLTAVSQHEEAVTRGYDVGAADYIHKPFSPAVLRAKVSVFVELHKKTGQLRRQGELLRIAERRERERALDEAHRASTRRYQTLAESLPQIVWTTDGAGVSTYTNRRWAEFAGLSPGQSGRLAVHPDDHAALDETWTRARATKSDFELAMRLRRARDGAYRWHLARAVAVLDAAGRVEEWIGTSTDIDDRVRAERALQLLADASEILAGSLDHRSTLPAVARRLVPDLADWASIHVLGPEGLQRLALVGPPGAVELLEGLSPLPSFFASPQTPSVAVPTFESTPVSPALPSPLRVVRSIRAPLVVRGRGLGELRVGVASERPLEEADVTLVGDLARRISMAIDTAQAYDLAQRERAAVEAASRLKDDFLAVLSHELRTPLNTTLGWAQMLRSGELDERTTAHAIETIERSARTQARLVDDLLDVSAIVTGKLRLQFAAVDVGATVRAAAETVRVTAEDKGIGIEVDVAPDLAPIRGDGARLQQVVWNLLTNAVKFCRRGDRVRVEARAEGASTRIVVADTGPGIDPSFLPHVFDRFRQANSSMTRAHGGLGLGLSIVKHLTELHGGTCHVESAGLGHGARFVVELPNGAPEASGRAPAPERRTLDGLRVLLVEDVEDARILVRTMLEQNQASVRAVGDATSALAEIETERPDVLVSDIGLPEIDGYELLRRARRLANGASLPAIALTAYATESDRRAAFEAGFAAHVIKPIDEALLVAEIARLAGR